MVFCGDCGGPTYIEGRFRTCDRCRIKTRQKRTRGCVQRITAAKVMEAQRLQDNIRQSQDMLDSMQVNQFGDSIPL